METLIQRLEKLVPDIVARREEIERGRRVPADIMKAIRDTGIFGLELPRAIGGQEVTPLEALDALEILARADGSVAWCAAQALVTGCVTGFMAEAGAKEVFADPKAVSAGAFAPKGEAVRVDGGVRVTGRWPFISGIHNAEWVMLGCLVLENGQPRMTPMGPEAIHVMVPAKAVEIHDTWYVSGLCGTGSQDVSVNDIFVPDRHIFVAGDPSRRRPEPLYGMPLLGWYVAHVATVSLGVARAALDEAAESAQKRVPTFTMAPLADQTTAQIELARAEAKLTSARLLLRDVIANIWRVVSTGDQPGPRQVAFARMAALNAAEVGAAVTRTASLLGGGSAIYSSSSLQRHMRDAEAITHHFSVAQVVWEDVGRVLTGRKPNAPMF
jgi:alkylation response protein AidB-like acyl-CoA dehydrogenase